MTIPRGVPVHYTVDGEVTRAGEVVVIVGDDDVDAATSPALLYKQAGEELAARIAYSLLMGMVQGASTPPALE